MLLWKIVSREKPKEGDRVIISNIIIPAFGVGTYEGGAFLKDDGSPFRDDIHTWISFNEVLEFIAFERKDTELLTKELYPNVLHIIRNALPLQSNKL